MMTNINLSLSAIQNYKTEKNIYLRVVGKGKEQRLEAVKQNWFGRLLMWLGCSSSSMSKVIKFLNFNMHSLCAVGKIDLENKGSALGKLVKKTELYDKRHPGKLNTLVNNIVTVYTQYTSLKLVPESLSHAPKKKLLLQNAPSIILEPSQSLLLPAPVKHNLPDVSRDLQLKKDEILQDNPGWINSVETWKGIPLEDQVWLLRVFELRKMEFLSIPSIPSNNEIVGCSEAVKLLLNRLSIKKDLEAITRLEPKRRWMGKFPDVLCLLINLKYLNLSQQDLTVCPDLSQNTLLELLSIRGNQLVHPPNLDANVKLKHLDIAENKLTTAPRLEKNVNLEILILFKNEVKVPPNLSKNISLKEIHLGHNKISGCVDLSNNINLLRIDLSDNPLSVPPNLTGTSKLQGLSLISCGLTKMPDLSQHRYLRGIQITENPLTEVSTPSTECFKDTVALSVTFANLASGELKRLQQLKKQYPKLLLTNFGRKLN